MYDFLCLLPHGTGSHSFLHYLNLHKEIHVASFVSVGTDKSRIAAHEKNFRPYIDCIGLSAKHYHNQDWVNHALSVCDRRLLIQSTRDPVECLISQINNNRMVAIIYEASGSKLPFKSIDEQIFEGAEKYISHHRATETYQAHSFDDHIVIDITELSPINVEETLTRVWLKICGRADRTHLISNDYRTAFGSKYLRYLRDYGKLVFKDGMIELPLRAKPDADMVEGQYDALANLYIGEETCLHTFSDINDYLPALDMSGPLNMCTVPSYWNSVHPKLRPKILKRGIMFFEESLRSMNQVFKTVKEANTFTIDDFTDSQKELLKKAIGDDVAAFGAQNPSVVKNWTVTNEFLGA